MAGRILRAMIRGTPAPGCEIVPRRGGPVPRRTRGRAQPAVRHLFPLIRDPRAFGRAPYLAVSQDGERWSAPRSGRRRTTWCCRRSTTWPRSDRSCGTSLLDPDPARRPRARAKAASAFVRVWCERGGGNATLAMSNRIYRAARATPPSGVPRSDARRLGTTITPSRSAGSTRSSRRRCRRRRSDDTPREGMLERVACGPGWRMCASGTRWSRPVSLASFGSADPERHPRRTGLHAAWVARQGLRERVGGTDDGRAARGATGSASCSPISRTRRRTASISGSGTRR